MRTFERATRVIITCRKWGKTSNW